MLKRNVLKFLIGIFTLGALFIACNSETKEEKNTAAIPAYMANIDSSYSPVNDFYRWAIGKWLSNNPVPASEASWGSFNEVYENNKALLKSIMEEAASANATKGSETQKIGDFYKSGMDSLALNKMGVQPLLPYFDRINEVKDKKQLIDLINSFQAEAIQTVYGIWVDQDMMNSSLIVPYFYQGGISLPDRDYYLKTDEDSKRIRDEYVKHVTNVFQLSGEEFTVARKQAEAILALETKMAEVSMDRLTMRDPYATYFPMSLTDFAKLTPAINWQETAIKIGLPSDMDTVIVSQPEYFKGLNKLLNTESIDIWKTYLRWNILAYFGDYLSDDLVNEFFHFNGTILEGRKENKPRWERVMLTIDEYMGMAVGKLYVDKAFKPEAKERLMGMIKNMQIVFKDRIQNLDWMSAETKQKAIVKLDKFMVKIGYPDKWRDYSSLVIDGNQPYVINIVKAMAYEYNRRLSKIGKPVDKTEWLMNPHEVNAYYNPSLNEIVFPAGILQPPFFDMNADDAYNYGAIGAVIGHEMTHGFDDQGRQFDSDGNLKNWWTSEDSAKFVNKASLLVDQYNECTVLDTIHVNGKLTLGENIADLGGLTIAYDALMRSDVGKKNEIINGLSAEQRFFLAWENSWKCNSTDEDKKQRIITDPHSPKDIRGNIPIKNMHGFHTAFATKEGDKMFLPEAKRVMIW